jgi:nucleoside-diphosphate-sugar epimerase
MRFTVVGGAGFIGSHLIQHFAQHGIECFCPERGKNSIFERPLGNVIYSAGVTADSRQRPLDAIRAHVCYLVDLLQRADFDSFLYLSGTRVYVGSQTAVEEQDLVANPHRLDDIYNLSKLTGEAACLADPRAQVRVARLSNVYGANWVSQNFLDSIIKDALLTGKVALRTALDSAKDYISVQDVVRLLPRIAAGGRRRVYNVASGRNVTNGELVDSLHKLTGCQVEVVTEAPRYIFPPISIGRIRDEFEFTAASVRGDLPKLVAEYRMLAEANRPRTSQF